MKPLFFLLLLLQISSAYSQTKKKQIALLISTNDSLSMQINTEREVSASKIAALEQSLETEKANNLSIQKTTLTLENKNLILSSEVDYFRQKYENLLKMNDSLLHANDSIKKIKTVYSPEVQKYSNGTRLESTNFEYRTPQRKNNQATVVQNRGKKNLKNANIDDENIIKEIDEVVDVSTKNRQGDPDRSVDLSLLDETGNGDKDIIDIDDSEGDMPFMSVEQMPQFPGGGEALNEWLLKNTTYPAAARENGIDGTVIVQFTVDRNGDIKDAHVVRKVHPLLDDAAMSALKKMPNWAAGQQNGKAVPVLINLPFRFGMKE